MRSSFRALEGGGIVDKMTLRCPKILTRVVLHETTVRSAHYYVLAAPGEFLDVGTMVSQ